jgi:pyrroline-5-carboxylate reductase
MALTGTLGILGFGNMGRAIAEGLCSGETMPADRIEVYDIDPTLVELARGLGMRTAESPEALARRADYLLLAVKPQTMDDALGQAKPGLDARTLVVSIAAGLSTAWFQSRLGDAFRVVRVMPNTPALAGAGAAAIAPSANCTPGDTRVAEAVFAAVGACVVVPEDAMDAVTALSGSGPAYFFLLVESMIEAGVSLGLERETAAQLAAQTCYGAGALLRVSGEEAATLRARVTSRGGTTAAALEQFAKDDLPAVVRRAMEAAVARSRELGA